MDEKIRITIKLTDFLVVPIVKLYDQRYSYIYYQNRERNPLYYVLLKFPIGTKGIKLKWYDFSYDKEIRMRIWNLVSIKNAKNLWSLKSIMKRIDPPDFVSFVKSLDENSFKNLLKRT